MANVTIEVTGNPMFPWRVSSLCRSAAEAQAKGIRIEAIDPLAFLPTYGAAIAIADGEIATGGGMATHVVETAPDLPPALEALQERAEADDPQVGGLKAGEADHV